MWGNRFWGNRFWGKRFWGKVGEDPPITSEDCLVIFDGVITDEVTAVNGIITDDAAFNGIIEEILAVNGLITEVIQHTSQVNVAQATLVGGMISLTVNGEPVGQAVIGLIDDSITAVNGLIDDTGIALNSVLCTC